MTFFWLTFLLVLCSRSEAANLRVAVASNFYRPLQHLAANFEEKTAINLSISQSSSGKHYQQIINGAPFDIFLSADETYPQKLYQAGLSHAPQTYAKGVLVAWSRGKPFTHPITETRLRTILQENPVSFANPKTAPYGRAAMEVLQAFNISLNPSRVGPRGESVNQVFHFVHHHPHLIGFLALSQLKTAQSSSSSQPGTFVRIPRHLYKPILQNAVILKSSQQVKAAKSFINFLLRDEVQSKLKTLGYL